MLASIFFTIKYLSWNGVRIKSDWHDLTQQARDCSRIFNESQEKHEEAISPPTVAQWRRTWIID
jgi:prophage maintenance system killer protein